MSSKMAEQLAPLASNTRLYTKALDILRAGHGGQVTTVGVLSFARFLSETEPMTSAMIGSVKMNELCLSYLNRVSADLDGSALSSLPVVNAGEQVLVGQKLRAHEGHRSVANQREAASAAPAPSLLGQLPDASTAKTLVPGKKGAASVAPRSSQAKVSALVARAATAKTVLDSYRVRDGRSIGDLVFSEIPALVSANTREAAVLRQIQKIAANVPGNAKIREVVKTAELERFIQRAAEVEDALA